MKFLSLDFVYVLPYCELSFCHRDHFRVSNYHFFFKRFKSGLKFKENVPWGLSNHGFINISWYWWGIKVVQKKPIAMSPKQLLAPKFQNICDYQFYWSLVQKILLTGFNLRYFKISQKMLFWKRWNWERMQRMSSIAVLNGHSGKPV